MLQPTGKIYARQFTHKNAKQQKYRHQHDVRNVLTNINNIYISVIHLS